MHNKKILAILKKWKKDEIKILPLAHFSAIIHTNYLGCLGLNKKVMDRQRIIAHIWMWTLVAVGIVLSFLILPSSFVLSPKNRTNLPFLLVLVFISALYYLASAFYFRLKHPIREFGLDDFIRAGTYGRVAHPTCTVLAITGWIIFIFSPSWEILAANLWATFVVFFWIELEKNIYKKNGGEENEVDVG